MTDGIERIGTPDAPAPAGHYSQATAWRDLVFVSGQLPSLPDGTRLADKPFEDQARQALANVFAILKAAGSGPEHVLRVTAYIVGVENWPAFNATYAAAFGDARPARTIVPVPELHFGCQVELEAIAVRGRGEG
ncbi:RidA family protein [Consotaella aegiceratis]|uniref:RidA family protein n=1 Tax=Consotaella aegiceratis TaxID=3097961 RepID=UPI002F41DDC5